jgi:hypothetical protein
MEAYVLIQTHTRYPIAETIRMIDGVADVEDVSGPYDAIARVLHDARGIAAIVEEIQAHPQVSRALVARVVDSATRAPSNEAAA